MEFQGLELSQVVLSDVKILNFAHSRENDLIEESGESIIVDEVHPESEMLKPCLFGLDDSFNNCLETFLSDSVVADVEELNVVVHL